MPTDYPGLNPQSTALYNQEQTRLLGALLPLTAGGVVETIEHIGSTSVPGLAGSARVDIGLAVWPFPLQSDRQALLEALGYESIAAMDSSEQRYCRQSDGVQLFIAEAGQERWLDYLILRDYWRANEPTRRSWITMMSNPQRFETVLPDARRWRVQSQGFVPVNAIASELKALACQWCISSGWALDLFLGEVSRLHYDVDVNLARADQLILQRYMLDHGWQWLTPFERRLEPWPPRMRLADPRHQAHAHRDGAFIDFLLTDIEHGVWHYRRAPMIIRSVERMSLTTSDGIPYLAPELVLLFKSKNTSGRERSKDQMDFERVHSHLEPERRAWLRWALIATEATHPWLEQLIR